MTDTKNEIIKIFKELLPEAQRALIICAGSAKSAEAALRGDAFGGMFVEGVCGSFVAL